MHCCVQKFLVENFVDRQKFLTFQFFLLVLTLWDGGWGILPPPSHDIVGLKTLWIILFMLVKVTYRIWDP